MQLLDGDARRTVPTPGRGSRQCGPRPVLPDRYDALTRWFLDRDAGKEGLVSIGAAPARQRGPRARKGYSQQWEQPPPEHHIPINTRARPKEARVFRQQTCGGILKQQTFRHDMPLRRRSKSRYSLYRPQSVQCSPR